MLRYFGLGLSVIGLAGCDLTSQEPLLDISTAQAIAADFTQRFNDQNLPGDFAVLTVLPDGRTLRLDSFRTEVDGAVIFEPPTLYARLHPLEDHPDFFIAESTIISPDDRTDATLSNQPTLGEFYGIVTCASGGVLVGLDAEIQRQSPLVDEFGLSFEGTGQVVIPNRGSLIGVSSAIIEEGLYERLPIEALELTPSDQISCDALLAGDR